MCPNVTILFAEDSAAAQQNYLEYLSMFFKRVLMASDGNDAWELYLRHHPDIVLLDIEMPRLDGLSLARKIRAHNSRTRIIIASGHGNEQRLLQAVELGLTRFLPKPFGRRELKEALSKAVEELDVSPRLALSHTYRWDRQVRKLYRHEEEIKLTAKERELLTLLSSNPKQTFSPYTIETRLWPDAPHDTDLTARLKTLMKRLRKKLPPECIENSYGEGYRLRLNR